MIYRIFNIIPLFFLLAEIASAQLSPTSMHELVDGRSMALGESWVARARTPSAWNSNPASLAGSVGSGIEYASRLGAEPPGFIYYSGSAWAGTPVGAFAIHYNKIDRGTFRPTFGTGDETMNSYDDVIALSYATDVLAPVSLGANLKQLKIVLADAPGIPEPESSLYFDFGIIASLESPFNLGDGTDSVHGGISVQNLGEDYVFMDETHESPVMQWLRAGFAYDAGFLMQESQPILRTSFTGEYRRLINAFEENENIASSFGAGIELMAYDIVSLRLGVTATPGENAFGETRGAGFHYGGGINVPLRKIGVALPLNLAFDYARFTAHLSTFGDGFITQSKHAFDIRMEYIAPIFK